MQDEWLRYSCQINLPGFGNESQQKLQSAKVLIVGAGGLGCPAAQYLTAAGIGRIGIADFDIVSTGNLHRQILYSPNEVGLLKAEVASEKLRQQNPQIKITAITEKITAENVMDILSGYDIAIDCTDNFETKYLLNDACVLSKKPLVYAAIYQYEGQISVLNVLNEDGTFSPNYRDLFSDVNAAEIPNCAEGGVIPTIAGIIGCIQANEAIKWITGIGELLSGKIVMIDAATLQSRIIKTGTTAKTIITKLPETIKFDLVSVNELKNNFELYELIDVRNEEERNSFHIGGKHITLAEIETKIALIDFTKPILFYCETGRRSAAAANALQKNFAHKKISSLDGGIKAWKENIIAK